MPSSVIHTVVADPMKLGDYGQREYDFEHRSTFGFRRRAVTGPLAAATIAQTAERSK